MSIVKNIEQHLEDANTIIRSKNAEILALRRTVEQQRRDNDTAEKIRKEIFNIASHSVEPPSWTTHVREKSNVRGTPITIWSDWHYGEVVDPEQIGGVNSFNHKIAKQRIQLLTDTVVDLCFNHMGQASAKYPGIIVCLAGDMVGGDIHEELANTNDRTTLQSVNDLTDILGGCIEALASKFNNVFLPCVVGNHGRSTRKPPSKNVVFTNYDWSIYCNLERYFWKDKRIQFKVSSETDVLFRSYGHRFLLTHGDNLGVKGGDGIIGALGPIMRGALKIGRSEAQIGRDFDTLLMGHWHEFMTPPGVIVNGTLKGYDEFAKVRLRARYQPPTQALLFTHPKHGIIGWKGIYVAPRYNAQTEKAWVSWEE